jgi:hypothetical protein
MDTTKLIATVAVLTAVAATPAAAAASNCPQGEQCRIALNHNEVLDRSPG